jgi:pimeloyl-ACP methyl ester carboxylesterase
MSHHAVSHARPVLAIHGSASSGKQWRALQVALGSERRVFAPDLPGYGGGAANRDRLNMLSGLLCQIGQPVDLVAHSFGGAIALKLAELWPRQIARLTLYDPLVVEPARADRPLQPDEFARLVSITVGHAPESCLEAFMDFWAGAGTWNSLNAMQKARLLDMHPSLMRDVREILRGDWAVPEPRFAGPLTVLRGALSPEITRIMCQRLTVIYPHAQMRELPGFGHMTPLTAAEAVAQKLRACLAPETPSLRKAA